LLAGCTSGLTPVEPLVEPLEVFIAGRGLVDVPLPVPVDTPTRITISSDGVDVRATLVDAQGHELGYADAPNRRMGVETLFIEPAARPPRLLRLAGIDHDKARGRITIEAAALPADSPADRRRIEATRLDSRACSEYPTFESADTAAVAFHEAAALHGRNGDHWHAGISLLQESGTRYIRHEQYLRSADLAFSARKALDRTDDALLEAYAERLEGAALYAAAGLATGGGGQHEQLVHRGLERLTSAARDLAKLGAHYEAGYAVNYRGVLNQEAGRVADARNDFKEALELFKKAGDSPAQALSLEGLALLDHNDGRSQDALDSFDAALRLIPAAEEPENYAHALHNSALPRQVLGRFDEAIARYQQAAQILADRHDALGEARALHGIGATLRLAGYPDRA
jgi:tetratricopeptide (TPR) repeat protein